MVVSVLSDLHSQHFQREKTKTKGFNWYEMKTREMTEEMKNDLSVVQMRKALDPKHFYKRSADTTPKYFEVSVSFVLR